MEEIIYNYEKLEQRMIQCKYTQSRLADKIQIGRNSLNLKLNNKTLFTQREIRNICDALEIPSSKIGLYFFNVVVHKTEQKRRGG